MTSPKPPRRSQMPPHVLAFVQAVAVAGLIPIAILVVSAFVELGAGSMNAIFVVAFLVVATLLGRALVLYRRSRPARS